MVGMQKETGEWFLAAVVPVPLFVFRGSYFVLLVSICFFGLCQEQLEK